MLFHLPAPSIPAPGRSRPARSRQSSPRAAAATYAPVTTTVTAGTTGTTTTTTKAAVPVQVWGPSSRRGRPMVAAEVVDEVGDFFEGNDEDEQEEE